MEFGIDKKRFVYLINKLLAKVKYLVFAISPRKYTTNNRLCKKNIYISYIVPFNKLNDQKYIKSHQNIQETLLMPDMFTSIGYNCYFGEFDRGFGKGEYDAVFGIEPNFERQCRNNPTSKKIYYATGAYCKHQNSMIIQRTNSLNEKYGTSVSYSRLVKEHCSSEIADHIIQIGSSYTVQTYPEEIRSKIICIDQSFLYPEFRSDFVRADFDQLRNNYIWFGSTGSVLKGVDLVLEAFAQTPDINLHVVGPIDDDFAKQILPIFSDCENIHLYGYISIDDPFFQTIVSKCGFCVYPSASEGGCPGALLTLLSFGIIPIVSKYAAFDGITEFGYIIETISVDSIGSTLQDSQSLLECEFMEKSNRAKKVVNKKFTLARYEEQMIRVFNDLLK